MKKIYSDENKILLYLLKSKLEERNIPVFFKNEFPPLAGEIPPIMAWPELWVEEQYAKTAKEIIRAELTSQLENKNKENWICPKCNESIESQFTECWNCGQSKVN